MNCFQTVWFQWVNLHPYSEDTSTGRLVSQPRALNPWPEGVHVSSIAVIGVPFYIGGLSGRVPPHTTPPLSQLKVKPCSHPEAPEATETSNRR